MDSNLSRRRVGRSVKKPRTGRPPFLTSEQREQLNQYIKDKAHETQDGRLTGADIHADIIKEFNNVCIIKLPPYSSELNPIEQAWSWLRQRCLANQYFTD